MASIAPRPTPGAARRPSITTSFPTQSPIARGATARSAVASPARANALKSPTGRSFPRGPSPNIAPDAPREALADSLRREMDQKEQLLVQLQNKEQALGELQKENDHLSSALNAAESRLAEHYADQSRMEDEMAARNEVMEKLRTQARELEKERRDLQRRYNEQTASFEAERQSFYDNEQHLKSRIGSLTQALDQARLQANATSAASIMDTVSLAETEHETPTTPSIMTKPSIQDLRDPEQEPAELTALKLELSTLSTSYNSLQSTLLLLQSQLVDLKRVNQSVQEENESYMILLREKTLSGEYDVMRQVVGEEEDDSEEEDDQSAHLTDSHSMHSSIRSALDTVHEDEEYGRHGGDDDDPDRALERELEMASRRPGGRKRTMSSAQKGESLADLPITGPGLDLAAELGRAENKDILDGTTSPPDTFGAPKHKRGKKSVSSNGAGRRVSSLATELAESSNKGNVERLEKEVKSLKDANRALSLYASKIIDRIIAQEGFEHVLSVDYEPATPAPTTPAFKAPEPKKAERPRAQSFFGFGSAPVVPPSPAPVERLTTFDSLPISPRPPATPSPTPPAAAPHPAVTAAQAASAREKRRSFSLDWSAFSIFSGEKKPPPPPEPSNLRRLTLKPGAPTIVSGRKLDTEEDEEDQRERERLNATMKLMGFEKPATPPIPPQVVKTYSEPAPQAPAEEATPKTPYRWSLFRSKSTRTEVPQLAPRSGKSSPLQPATLTQQALEHAEAEQKLAALDAHEKSLSEQLSKGGSSGFTEPPSRSLRRKERSGTGSIQSGSGSTVWSAGMSRDGHDD